MSRTLMAVAAMLSVLLLCACGERAAPPQGQAGVPVGPTIVARVIDSGSSAPVNGRMPGPVLVLWSDHVLAVSDAFPDASKSYRFAHVDEETSLMIVGSIESAARDCDGRQLVGPDMQSYSCAAGGRAVTVPRGAFENPKNWTGYSCADPIKRVLEAVPKIPSDDTVASEERNRRLKTLPKAGLLTADAWRALE
jgi:hypothetical protein